MAAKKAPRAEGLTEVHLANSLIDLISETGESRPTNLAIKLNITAKDVRELMLSPSFEPRFKKRKAKGFKAWKDSQSAETNLEAVKAAVARDLPKYYEELKVILLESDQLDDKTKATALLDLIKTSKALTEGTVEEVTVLNPNQLKVMQEALKDVSVH